MQEAAPILSKLTVPVRVSYPLQYRAASKEARERQGWRSCSGDESRACVSECRRRARLARRCESGGVTIYWLHIDCTVCGGARGRRDGQGGARVVSKHEESMLCGEHHRVERARVRRLHQLPLMQRQHLRGLGSRKQPNSEGRSAERSHLHRGSALGLRPVAR